MHVLFLLYLAIAILPCLGLPAQVHSSSSDEDDALVQLTHVAHRSAIDALSDLEVRSFGRRRNGQKPCTSKTLRVRREWGSLSAKERKEYIRAVKCLQSLPPRTPSTLAAGVRSRFDDFIATHINQTTHIHYTANFLAWHRFYTWSYEEALRTECGFRGAQPYWDWTKTARSGLEESPIFDGSDTSMSGNGAYDAALSHRTIALGVHQHIAPIYIPTGHGGGCITTGPFKDMSVNLGPVGLEAPGGAHTAPSGNPLDYNPRCLRRDLTDYINRHYVNVTSVLRTILRPQNIIDFQNILQGVPGTGDLGIHAGGHFTMGGDPGRDVSNSPGDPAFYLHHGMVDKVWWIWQNLDPKTRIWSDQALGGTITFLNKPPSRNATLEDTVFFGFAAGRSRTLRELMSTTDGPFCYIYY